MAREDCPIDVIECNRAIGAICNNGRDHLNKLAETDRILPAAPERIANRVQLLPHLSIARFKRHTEEEDGVV
jgi:hypothetical protein